MPQRNEPLSLRKAVMKTIVLNFDLVGYSCRDTEQMHKLVQSDKYLEVEGPFGDLPTSLLEDLLETIREVRSLNRKHMHLLMREQLESINLSFGTGEIYFGLHFLERCKKLRQLQLAYLRHINPPILMKLIPHLGSITILNLRMTMAVDQVLGLLGEHCPHLRELNVASTPITDRGLCSLCLSSEGERRCQQLCKLVVTETRISAAGAAFALHHLPYLTDFDYDNIFQVFDCLDRATLELGLRQTLPRFHLTTLISHVQHVRPESIELAVAVCPSVASLSLANCQIPSDALYSFMNLECLSNISITNGPGMLIDFFEGVLPLLMACGPRLESLILNKFATVDVAAISQACPNIQNLALSAVIHYGGQTTPADKAFSNLKALELWSESVVDVGVSTLKLLLSHCHKIQNILMKSIQVLTDEVLYDIWATNPMPCLSHLTLDQCHNLSPRIIHRLFDSSNQLNVVRIWSCVLIGPDDNIRLSRRVKEENMDLYLEWFKFEQ